MIGHELRTPLTSIVGYVELLDTFSENLDNKQKDFVSVLHHQTDMLAWLVSQITMLTSLKTGKYRLDLEPIDICQVISSLSGRLSEISDIKQVRIISDITEHQKVNTDRNAFLGICMNLVFAFQRLSNIETMISLSFHDTREKLTIEVSDNSSPFGSQDMEIVYEMFTSLPTKPSTTIKGTIGLPLSIAKEFTLLLSGKIWFDNDAYGNRVIVELPFVNA
jgi:signal transduction histidine kinase